MIDIASRESQYLVANRSYADPNDFGYTLPDEVGDRYTFDLSTTNASGMPLFTIRATPIGPQASDGWLQLNSEGEKTSESPGKWER